MGKANKAAGRTYGYDTKYEDRPEQVKARVARNKARKLMEKKMGANAMKGKDLDHKDGNPLNNTPSNWQVISKSRNRSKK